MYSLLTWQREVGEEIREVMVKDEPTAKLIQFGGLFYSKKIKNKEKNSKSSSLMID